MTSFNFVRETGVICIRCRTRHVVAHFDEHSRLAVRVDQAQGAGAFDGDGCTRTLGRDSSETVEGHRSAVLIEHTVSSSQRSFKASSSQTIDSNSAGAGGGSFTSPARNQSLNISTSAVGSAEDYAVDTSGGVAAAAARARANENDELRD